MGLSKSASAASTGTSGPPGAPSSKSKSAGVLGKPINTVDRPAEAAPSLGIKTQQGDASNRTVRG